MHHAVRRGLVRSAGMGVAATLFALGLSTPARANGCSVTATPVTFGSYNPTTRTMVSTVASLTYTCTSKVRRGIRILLANGNIVRTMRQPGAEAIYKRDSLHFLLTLDPAGTIPWGDGTGGTQVYTDPHPPLNQPVTVQIYGFLPESQDPVPGQYQDALRVIADFW